MVTFNYLLDGETLSLWWCVFIVFCNCNSPESLMKRSLNSIIFGWLVALESHAEGQNEKCSGHKI